MKGEGVGADQRKEARNRKGLPDLRKRLQEAQRPDRSLRVLFLESFLQNLDLSLQLPNKFFNSSPLCGNNSSLLPSIYFSLSHFEPVLLWVPKVSRQESRDRAERYYSPGVFPFPFLPR